MFLDIIACGLELLGAWLVGNKNKCGFLFLLAGCFFWLAVGMNSELPGLAITGVVFALINIRNYRKWSKGKGNCGG